MKPSERGKGKARRFPKRLPWLFPHLRDGVGDDAAGATLLSWSHQTAGPLGNGFCMIALAPRGAGERFCTEKRSPSFSHNFPHSLLQGPVYRGHHHALAATGPHKAEGSEPCAAATAAGDPFSQFSHLQASHPQCPSFSMGIMLLSDTSSLPPGPHGGRKLLLSKRHSAPVTWNPLQNHGVTLGKKPMDRGKVGKK